MFERLTSEPLQLGECPIWDHRTGHLFWIDIDGMSISRFDPRSGVIEESRTQGRPGSIALSDSADMLLLAMENQVGWFDWSDGSWEPFHELEPHGIGNRLNDGRCDPAGRFWVGSMHEDPNAVQFTGMLHRLESGGSTVVITEVGISNGLAFTPSGQQMYFADTLKRMVWAHEYDLESGEPGPGILFSDFSGIPGNPDGACLDEQGCYWSACAHGSSVVRLTPEGQVDRIVEVPARIPTMPAFGGTDLGTMFLTTIGSEQSANEFDGHVFAFDVGVRGLPEPVFAG